MNPYKHIQESGYRAFTEGVPKSRNPFQYASLKNGGIGKQAAWNTGWMKAEKDVKNINNN